MPARLLSIDEVPYARSMRRLPRTTSGSSWDESEDNSSASSSNDNEKRSANSGQSNGSNVCPSRHSNNSSLSSKRESESPKQEYTLAALNRYRQQQEQPRPDVASNHSKSTSGSEDSRRLKRTVAIGSNKRPTLAHPQKVGSARGIRYKASASSSKQQSKAKVSGSNVGTNLKDEKLAKIFLAPAAQDTSPPSSLTPEEDATQSRRQRIINASANKKARAAVRHASTRKVNFAPVDVDGAYSRLGWKTGAEKSNSPPPKGSVLKNPTSKCSSAGATRSPSGDTSTASGDTQSLTLADSPVENTAAAPCRIPSSLLMHFPHQEKDDNTTEQDQEQPKGQSSSSSSKPIRPDVHSLFQWNSNPKLPMKSSIRSKMAADKAGIPEPISEESSDYASSSAASLRSAKASSKASSRASYSKSSLSSKPKKTRPKPNHTHSDEIMEISLSLANVACKRSARKLNSTEGNSDGSKASTVSTSSRDTGKKTEEKPTTSPSDQAKVMVVQGESVPQSPDQKAEDALFLIEDPFALLKNDEDDQQDANISDKAIFNGVWGKLSKHQDAGDTSSEEKAMSHRRSSLGHDSEQSSSDSSVDNEVWRKMQARHSKSKAKNSSSDGKSSPHDEKCAPLPELPSKNKVRAMMA